MFADPWPESREGHDLILHGVKKMVLNPHEVHSKGWVLNSNTKSTLHDFMCICYDSLFPYLLQAKNKKQLLRLGYFHAKSLLLNFPAFQNGRGSTESSFEMMATLHLIQACSETGLLSINAKMPLVEIYSSCLDELQTWPLLEWGGSWLEKNLIYIYIYIFLLMSLLNSSLNSLHLFHEDWKRLFFPDL